VLHPSRRATSNKKVPPGKPRRQPSRRKVIFDGVIAAPFGMNLAQTHRFPRTLVENASRSGLFQGLQGSADRSASLCADYCPLAEESE